MRQKEIFKYILPGKKNSIKLNIQIQLISFFLIFISYH